jgi:hypothetical protein
MGKKFSSLLGKMFFITRQKYLPNKGRLTGKGEEK